MRFLCFFDSPTVLAGAPAGERENVWLTIAPRNDIIHHLQFTADVLGAQGCRQLRAISGEGRLETVPDIHRDEGPAVPGDWRLYHGVDRESWWAEMEIPWRMLGLPSRPEVLGLEYGRAFFPRPGNPREQMVWPLLRRWPGYLLDPGEALIGATSGAPQRLELDTPRFGRNYARLVLGSLWPRRPTLLRTWTESPEGRILHRSEMPISARSDAISFEYALDRACSASLHPFSMQRLVIEMCDDATNETLYLARLPMDRHLGVCVDEPYGEKRRERRLPFNGEPSRRDQALERIVRALPRLERRSTAQGAPSDFCLAPEDEAPNINLMADNAWEQLAQLVEERFDTSEDRLIGAMALIGQKSVTNLYLRTPCETPGDALVTAVPCEDAAAPLDMLRFGGGTESARAAALAALLEHLVDPVARCPFETRLVSLHAGGATAVAVRYGEGMTVLDPSALAFFLKADNTLATVEEIIADAELRKEGAGLREDLYARLDADEILRLRPTRFSESAGPSEAKHAARSLRTLIVGAHGVELRSVDAQPTAREASLSVFREGSALVARVEVRGVDLAALSARDLAGERVHLALDLRHEHDAITRVTLAATGAQQWRIERQGESGTFRAENAPLPCEGAITPTDTGYVALFRIPLRQHGGEPLPPAVGINVWIEGRWPQHERLALLPPNEQADLYLTDTRVTLTGIDYGAPCWGANTGRATLRNDGVTLITALLHAETRLARRRRIRRARAEVIALAPGEVREVEFAYEVDPEERIPAEGGQQVALVVESANVEVFREARPILRNGAVQHRYGAAAGNCPPPLPGERDFLERKVCQICSRLPVFKHVTTREKAPSDFVLRSEDGALEFNLMDPGILQHIARGIEERFDTDMDRLLGLFFLGRQPVFMGRANALALAVEGAGPLSIMRLALFGVRPDSWRRAVLFAGMASALTIGGRRVAAQAIMFGGRPVTAVPWRGSRTILDPDAGHFFLAAGGRDFATIEKIRNDPDTLTTAGPGERALYMELRDGGLHPAPTLEETFSGVFPLGAPRA